MPASRPHLLTLDQWWALGEEELSRTELQEGVLLVLPNPGPEHQRTAGRVCSALDSASPSGFEAVYSVDVIVDNDATPTVRVPDVVVLRVDAPEPLHVSDVALAVEILSPGTRRTDLVMKRHEYAEAGIAHYWIVDLAGAGVALEALTLVDGEYRSETVTGVFEASAPFPVRIDLASLL